ncbi:MAG: dTDP-4-amino-4,6-dideoxygalactose transaminase [Candidatus Methanomarinus sp.]|nr:MAG: dTDP-4-amino-4,6-dideoxygalactose transaminase [ANME-2 cluster archaeon]
MTEFEIQQLKPKNEKRLDEFVMEYENTTFYLDVFEESENNILWVDFGRNLVNSGNYVFENRCGCAEILLNYCYYPPLKVPSPHANYIIDHLNRDDLLFPKISSQMKSTFLRLPVYFENINKEKRNKFIKPFIRSGIKRISCLVDSLPYLFKKNSIEYPIAEKMTNITLTVPTHPNMDKRDLDLIIDLLNHCGDQ